MSKRFRRAFFDIKRNIPYCGKAPEVKCAQNTTVLSSRSKWVLSRQFSLFRHLTVLFRSEWKEIESDSGLAMSISISRSYPGEGVTSGYLTQTTREKNTAPARMWWQFLQVEGEMGGNQELIHVLWPYYG